MAIEKIKILRAVLELPAKQPIHHENGPNGQCCFSKTALRILICSMTIGGDSSFELIFIETYAPKFFGHNKFFLCSVSWNSWMNSKMYYDILCRHQSYKSEHTTYIHNNIGMQTFKNLMGASENQSSWNLGVDL